MKTLSALTRKAARTAMIAAALTFPSAVTHAQDLSSKKWEDIVAEAKGGTVNWFMWGGADNINQYVSSWIGNTLEEKYNISLNRIGITDTAEAVNIVLGEKQAGIDDNGTVDMIWINGGNFRTMKQGDLLYCGYLDALPNNKLIDWSDASIANDFGLPVAGCEVPWNRVQFAFAYDSARTPNPPQSISELIDWVEKNPGQFAYPAATDFNGSVFIRHVFYHAAGGAENLLGDFDQKKFDEIAPIAWGILNEMKPHLWREGTTYPNSITALQQLFANQEVALYFNYDPAIFGINVETGIFPDTTRSYGLKSGTIGNTNYVAIPYNSPNKAAAMVLANLLVSANAQLEKAKPEVWGVTPAIDVARLDASLKKAFADLPRNPAVVSPQELAKNALPELNPDWIKAIEEGWQANVAE
jgi:putative spermidine/putrescine transport system substrate-binding protein